MWTSSTRKKMTYMVTRATTALAARCSAEEPCRLLLPAPLLRMLFTCWLWRYRKTRMIRLAMVMSAMGTTSRPTCAAPLASLERREGKRTKQNCTLMPCCIRPESFRMPSEKATAAELMQVFRTQSARKTTPK
ncbi:hypothetical protein JZ751_017379 [Albula glossodonta]|uniref:Uncharacterized protein n=1 Tax=Albula glossodonta TaxID=121402 RepID=A0A8T2PHJ3_9TELE|nr:hypothetical protein JZ751_017379 [Albula glossodonta]